jgi:hypothetical protein
LANPPAAPKIYDNGPNAPLLLQNDVSTPEKVAFALYEGVLQVAEARIHATSCASSAGTFNMSAYADGLELGGLPTIYNSVKVTSDGGSFKLDAELAVPDSQDRGQSVKVKQNGSGILKSKAVRRYKGDFSYNYDVNMMTSDSSVEVVGANGVYDKYYGTVIKDFYRGELLDMENPEFYIIYDWGLQALLKEGYPVNKYWQRSKTRRSDGVNGRTVFVKDRLVGNNSCRLTIDTKGVNAEDLFSQTGTLKIETVAPKTSSKPLVDF